MNVYTIGLITGGLGLLAMTIGGAAHQGHDSSHDVSAGHGGHGHGDASPDVSHHAGTSPHAASHTDHGAHLPSWLLSLLTPRALFTALTGFGAVGLALGFLFEPARALLAVAGGVGFEIALAGPLSRLALGFASKPGLTLESCVMDEVQAVAGFDAEGNGLVSVELDGQIVQVLATLRTEDQARGAKVRIGDRLRVEEVDGARQRFVVSLM